MINNCPHRRRDYGFPGVWINHQRKVTNFHIFKTLQIPVGLFRPVFKELASMSHTWFLGQRSAWVVVF
jgi:hypothetical protein